MQASFRRPRLCPSSLETDSNENEAIRPPRPNFTSSQYSLLYSLEIVRHKGGSRGVGFVQVLGAEIWVIYSLWPLAPHQIRLRRL